MRLVLLLLVCVFWTVVHAISWLSLHELSQVVWQQNVSASCKDARLRRALTGLQAQLCSSQPGLMSAVVVAASTAVSFCQRAFRHYRWNCSSVTLAPHFSPDLTTGTREHAVVHAFSTASLVWSVARACRKGTVLECGCGAYPLDPPNGRFQWGGCSDNLHFARTFSRKFLVNERRHVVKEEKNERWRNNGEASHEREHRKIRRRKERRRRRKKGRAMLKREAKIKKIKRRAILRMNRHNRRVGRKVTGTALSTSCKCHGVSGSCTLKTCWKVLSAFNKV
ncbi:Wnt [Trinorchestia longiramus]|nr:Wnt [Trinorchestia longiramus]